MQRYTIQIQNLLFLNKAARFYLVYLVITVVCLFFRYKMPEHRVDHDQNSKHIPHRAQCRDAKEFWLHIGRTDDA